MPPNISLVLGSNTFCSGNVVHVLLSFLDFQVVCSLYIFLSLPFVWRDPVGALRLRYALPLVPHTGYAALTWEPALNAS